MLLLYIFINIKISHIMVLYIQYLFPGIKNFVCAHCGKRVARVVELQIHMRTHTGERNFKCSYCDKKFSTSSNLRHHERKHTGNY